ncbi:MAG: hypothetical protein HKN79_03265 [Flavobacteriales bacterium]|nr:hypothetical protein [Flavobacteriales bacterium]
MLSGLKKKLWIGIIILVLLITTSLLGVFRFEIDVAWAMWAIVGFIVAYGLFIFLSHWISPKKQVTISTKVELSAPPRILKSVRNYRLKVSTEKHIEEKGRERTIKMDELIMSFNSADHPDAYSYCMQVIGAHMDACLRSAREAHPDAHVTGSQLNLPPEIKQLDS